MRTQDKVTRIIKGIAEDAGFELAVDARWGNAGVFRITPKDSLTPVLSIDYDFQNDYSGFTFEPAFNQGRDGAGKLHYVRPEELDARLIAPIRAIVTSLQTGPAK